MFAIVVHGNDMWVSQCCCCLSFYFEFAGKFDILWVMGWKRFNGNLTIQAWVCAEPDICHSSSTDAPYNLIAPKCPSGSLLRYVSVIDHSAILLCLIDYTLMDMDRIYYSRPRL